MCIVYVLQNDGFAIKKGTCENLTSPLCQFNPNETILFFHAIQ